MSTEDKLPVERDELHLLYNSSVLYPTLFVGYYNEGSVSDTPILPLLCNMLALLYGWC